jgi:hypothetical protein
MTWLKSVGIALVLVPAYAVWAGSFIVEHIVSVVTSGYYIYMTGFLSFDWLYSLSRNLIHKKITNFAFWYSVSILGLNLLALIIPTSYLGIYIINYLITEETDASVVAGWAFLGLPPTLALFFTLPFFISSMSWASVFRVLQSY